MPISLWWCPCYTKLTILSENFSQSGYTLVLWNERVTFGQLTCSPASQFSRKGNWGVDATFQRLEDGHILDSYQSALTSGHEIKITLIKLIDKLLRAIVQDPACWSFFTILGLYWKDHKECLRKEYLSITSLERSANSGALGWCLCRPCRPEYLQVHSLLCENCSWLSLVETSTHCFNF